MEKGITRLDAFVLLIMLLGLIVVVLFFQTKLLGFAILSAPQPEEETKQAETQSAEIPKVELIELQVPDCNLCLTFDTFKEQLKGLDIVLKESTLPYNSAEAKELIEKYNIKAVPTIIVRGDISKVDAFKNWGDVGTIESDALVFRNNVPVYYDLEKKRFIGAVSLIELTDPSCTNCLDPLRTVEMSQLLSAIKLVSFRRVDVNSAEGQELIRKHFIDFAPALIFSSGIADYNKELFSNFGSFSPDGSFVVRKKYAPYKDLTSGEVKGKLYLKIIEVSNCWACKDAKDMLNFLNTRLGLTFSDLVVYDFNTQIAHKFIEDYTIHYLPAAIVTGDTKSYNVFSEIWPKIGRVFTGGVYALDGYPYLGAGYYYDTNTEQIITASQQ